MVAYTKNHRTKINKNLKKEDEQVRVGHSSVLAEQESRLVSLAFSPVRKGQSTQQDYKVNRARERLVNPPPQPPNFPSPINNVHQFAASTAVPRETPEQGVQRSETLNPHNPMRQVLLSPFNSEANRGSEIQRLRVNGLRPAASKRHSWEANMAFRDPSLRSKLLY